MSPAPRLPKRPLVHRPRRAGAPGFTLVEMLIALSLVGLIVLLLFSGLRLGSRSWEGVEAAAERTAELRVVRNFLERALLQARSTRVTFDAEQRLVFAGDAEGLELVAPLAEQIGVPGLYLLRLSLEEGGEHPRLVLTRWLLHPEVLEGTAEIPQWRPLAEGGGGAPLGADDRDLAAGVFGSTLLLEEVGELAISYFGRKDGADEPEWTDEWIDQPTLPAAVRMRLTTPRQSWPDLLVRLADGAQ